MKLAFTNMRFRCNSACVIQKWLQTGRQADRQTDRQADRQTDNYSLYAKIHIKSIAEELKKL